MSKVLHPLATNPMSYIVFDLAAAALFQMTAFEVLFRMRRRLRQVIEIFLKPSWRL
jgi:hypothetical protein